MSLRRQCELLGVNHSSLYYKPCAADETTLALMKWIDEKYTRHPLPAPVRLKGLGFTVNRKRIQRLYQLMGLEAVYPKPNLSKATSAHPKHPYLLRGIEVKRCNQGWSTDITYIRLNKGLVYLMAIMDWYSRYVLDWALSISLEADFCITALRRALSTGKCDIFNTEQGAQFTCAEFTGLLLAHDIQISMEGKGRALDNIFVERLWRSVKYESVYLSPWETGQEARSGLREYFGFYNYERPHQSLNYQTPWAVYSA